MDVMKPRPRRDYKEGQHRQNVEIRKKQVKKLFEEEKKTATLSELLEDLVQKENLYEFAQRVSKLPPEEGGFTIFLKDMRYKQKNNICLFCDKQLEMYESKAGNRYLANADKSPHRKVYKCCNSWGEYNG